MTERVLYPLHEGPALDDQQCDQLGLIDISAGEFAQMHVFGKQLVGEFLLVVDAGDRDNGEFAQMRIENNRLRVGVADDSNT